MNKRITNDHIDPSALSFPSQSPSKHKKSANFHDTRQFLTDFLETSFCTNLMVQKCLGSVQTCIPHLFQPFLERRQYFFFKSYKRLCLCPFTMAKRSPAGPPEARGTRPGLFVPIGESSTANQPTNQPTNQPPNQQTDTPSYGVVAQTYLIVQLFDECISVPLL